MRNWHPDFITELQKKTGLEPCLILRTTIDGTVYDISDHVITFPVGALDGFTSTKSWVATWGQIHEQISGNIGEILIADMALTLLVDQNDDNNIRHLAQQHELEKNPTELYLWLPSLDATLIPPQLVTKGHIEDIDLPDETQVNITIEDETSRLQDYLGTKITSEAYPLCDPDAVGKMIPIPIGRVSKLPALCVDSGWVTSITTDISEAATSLTVSELPSYPVINKTITIDDEQILILPNRQNMLATAAVGASSSFANMPPSRVADGDVRGAGSNHWASATGAALNQDISITAAVPLLLDEINIILPQDNYTTPLTPTLEMLAGPNYKQTGIQVLSSVDGTVWTTLFTTPTNDKIWLQIKPGSPVLAKYLIVRFTAKDSSGYCRCVEVEAWGKIPGADERTFQVLRGQGGTGKVLHTKGSVVIEKKTTPLVYLCADYALDTIDTIMARVRGVDVDITPDCTKYLGTALNQLAAYPGKAAITIPDFARVSQRISIALNGGVSATDPGHGHNAGSLAGSATDNQTATGISDALVQLSWSWTAIQNQNRFPAQQSSVARNATFAAPGGTPSSGTMTATVTANVPSTGGIWYMACGGKIVSDVYGGSKANFTVPITLDATAAAGNVLQLCIAANATGQAFSLSAYGSGTIHSATRSVTYNTAQLVSIAPRGTGISVASTLALSGNSVADIMIGDMILVDCSLGGNTPAETFDRLLSTYCNDTTLTQIGTLPDFYQFNGAITEYRKKIEWLDLLAFQCRCWYRKIAGVSRLIVRSATPDDPVTIPACCLTAEGIKALRYKKAPKADVINVINVLYNRDWSSRNTTAESYQSSKLSTDDASIADYGRIEQPNMFLFDFITSDAMASDVGTFFHDFYAVRKWLISFATYLDWAYLEFADDVLLPFANDLTGVIVEAGLDLSNGEQMPRIAFTIATTHIPLEVENGIHTLLGIQVHTKNREAITHV